MSKDPWTDPDPQPGDFDADIEKMGPDDIEHHAGHPDAKLTVLVGVSPQDARRLNELAAERHTSVEQVVAELVRSA
jgi:hypothetical protein